MHIVKEQILPIYTMSSDGLNITKDNIVYTSSSVITDTKLIGKKIGKGSVKGSSFYVYTERSKESKKY